MSERRSRAESKWAAITAVFGFMTFFIDRDHDHPDWAAEFNRFGSHNPQIGKTTRRFTVGSRLPRL